MQTALLEPRPDKRSVSLREAPRGVVRPSVQAATSVELRVVTYNIWCGRRWAECLSALRKIDADVICLQEVVPDDAPRARGLPTASRIAADLGLRSRFEALWRRLAVPVGNMTLVRGRIGEPRVLHVGTSEPYGLVTRVEVGGVEFILVNVHLAPLVGPPAISFLPSEVLRLREALHLDRTLRTIRGPVVVAGDFNSFRGAPAYAASTRRLRDVRRMRPGRHLATRPTYGLPFVIDHVLVSEEIGALDYAVHAGDGSDHRLVSTRLRIPRP